MDTALKKAGIEEGYFHTGEVIMNYVAGPPNGTPLVFIPGQTVTWAVINSPQYADEVRSFVVRFMHQAL